MIENVKFTVIGHVICERDTTIDDNWGEVVSYLHIDDSVIPEEALTRVTDFSHIEVIYYLDRVKDEKIHRTSRKPRGLAHLPTVGMLAQRAKNRFNKIGLSRCELLGRNGSILEVKGLDAINETPILEIKPWMEEFGPRGEIRQPSWVSQIMSKYYN